MHVYRRTNTINGKVYIGKTTQTVEARWQQMVYEAKRGTAPVDYAIRKYGAAVLKTDILYTAKTLEELNSMETFFIILHQSHLEENGYNLTLGGDGAGPGPLNPMWGKTHTDEVKQAQRLRRLGAKNSPESNEKRRLALTGDKNPAFGKVYMDERSVVGRRKGGLSNLGKKRSLATRTKMSISAQGKEFSEEHCLHISQAKSGQGLGRKHSPESIERMRVARSLYWANRKGGEGVSPSLST